MSSARINKTKYLLPPTKEQIRKLIYKELKTTYSAIELFYGIPGGTIKGAANGHRPLPAKYWHIFYDKVRPAYGVGFLKPVVKERKIKEIPQKQNTDLNNCILDILKEKLS